MGAPAIVEEAVMIIVTPPIGSAETKKSVTPSVRKFKAQEGYFIGWMLSNGQDHRAAEGGSGASPCWAFFAMWAKQLSYIIFSVFP